MSGQNLPAGIMVQNTGRTGMIRNWRLRMQNMPRRRVHDRHIASIKNCCYTNLNNSPCSASPPVVKKNCCACFCKPVPSSIEEGNLHNAFTSANLHLAIFPGWKCSSRNRPPSTVHRPPSTVHCPLKKAVLPDSLFIR